MVEHRSVHTSVLYAAAASILAIVFAAELLGGPFRAIERSDYMTYHTAARIVLAGDGGCLYEPACQAEAQRALIGEEPSFDGGTLPFTSPPTVALLVAPLGLLPLHVAFAVFTLLSLGVLAIGVWRLAAATGMPLLTTVLVLTAWPTALAVVRGQLTLLVAGLLALSLVAVARGDLGRGGAAAGLATLKPTLATLWLASLVAIGRWVALVAAAVTGLLLLVAAWVLVGPQSVVDYPAYALGLAGGASVAGIDVAQMINWRGAAERVGAGLGLTIAGSLVTLLLVAATWWWQRGQTGLPLTAAAALTATPLVVPHANQHEALLPMLAVLLVLGADENRRRALAIGAVIVHALLWSGPFIPAQAAAWLLFGCQAALLTLIAGLAWQRRRYDRSVLAQPARA